jgi:ABC-type amino acid transport substrate-binding protein
MGRSPKHTTTPSLIGGCLAPYTRPSRVRYPYGSRCSSTVRQVTGTICSVRFTRLLLDILALAVVIGYGWSIQHTRAGAADPYWTEITRRGVLRVGTDPGFRPFAEERDGHWTGYDVELAEEIARRLGFRVTWQAVSYDALYDTLAAGQVDLLASALPLAPEQGWRARFSSAYLDAGQVLVTRRNSTITGVGSLEGHKVGAALGSEGDTLLRNLRRDHPDIAAHSEYETPAELLRALEQGALDAALTDSISALSLTESNREFVIRQGLTFEPYVLAMPAGAYRLQAEIDRVLDALRRDGFIERLNTRWLGAASTAQ